MLVLPSGALRAASPGEAQGSQAAPLWNDPLAFLLGAVGVVMTAGAFASAHLKGGRGPALVAFLLALCGATGAWGCAACLGRANRQWSGRLRLGWASIALAGALFCAGCLVSAFGAGAFGAFGKRGAAPAGSLADWFLMAQQPVLAAGLFALAWRNRSLGLMRMVSDTLIIGLAALVLLWSFVFQPEFGRSGVPLLRAFAIYYPLFDAANGFCALLLLGQARERPGLARASWFLLAGVACLALSHAMWALSAVKGHEHPMGASALSGWTWLLIGLAAVVHARRPLEVARSAESAAEQNASSEEESSSRSHFARWHQVAMLWLPYAVTLGVSFVLIVQQLHRDEGEALRRVLPVLVLLLAIAARQMIALWDNLQLAHKLTASKTDLERDVGERTRHLSTLVGITSTLNTSFDRRTVLRVTLEKTIEVTDASAGGIWLREPRRSGYEGGGAPQYEWVLMHWQGEGDATTPSLLRDLAIADACEGDSLEGEHFHVSSATREAMQAGTAPPRQRLILVPVRSQGVLLGAMGLMRDTGDFNYEARALVESVALEAGTALQNARLYSEAERRADRDSVTDLLNHRAVQERLATTLSLCKRTGGTFSIVMMDLNNFKFFNDTYGHPVGDEVLRRVARGLRESCRDSDILGRYGGDEFIVVLPDTDASGTLDVCARIKATLDAKHFEPVPGTRLPIGTAFGWAAYPQDGENIMDLLSAADANLYNHKRGGASYISQTQKEVQENRDEMKKLKSRSHGGSFGVLDALVTAIDNKDHYTRHHSEEVTFLSLLVAREINYSREQLEAVRISGLLHDVGKIAVPDSILRHPGKLGRDEWDIMQQHPVFGALIVKDVPHLEAVSDGIKYHHEKWDGSGYPEKLVGEDIPEMGRLLAMGDCYSALTTDRPYRKGWKPEDALEEIERCAGTHFDPRLCGVFLEVMRRELARGADTGDYGARIAEEFSARRDEVAA